MPENPNRGFSASSFKSGNLKKLSTDRAVCSIIIRDFVGSQISPERGGSENESKDFFAEFNQYP